MSPKESTDLTHKEQGYLGSDQHLAKKFRRLRQDQAHLPIIARPQNGSSMNGWDSEQKEGEQLLPRRHQTGLGQSRGTSECTREEGGMAAELLLLTEMVQGIIYGI